MPTVTIHEAKTNLSELIRRVEAGEEIVIARGDKPVAVLKEFKSQDIAKLRKAGMNSLKDKFPLPQNDVLMGEMTDEDFIEAFGQDFYDLHKDGPKAGS